MSARPDFQWLFQVDVYLEIRSLISLKVQPSGLLKPSLKYTKWTIHHPCQQKPKLHFLVRSFIPPPFYGYFISTTTNFTASAPTALRLEYIYFHSVINQQMQWIWDQPIPNMSCDQWNRKHQRSRHTVLCRHGKSHLDWCYSIAGYTPCLQDFWLLVAKNCR